MFIIKVNFDVAGGVNTVRDVAVWNNVILGIVWPHSLTLQTMLHTAVKWCWRGVSSQRNERKERKNGYFQRKLQPIETELSSFLLNSSF